MFCVSEGFASPKDPRRSSRTLPLVPPPPSLSLSLSHTDRPEKSRPTWSWAFELFSRSIETEKRAQQTTHTLISRRPPREAPAPPDEVLRFSIPIHCLEHRRHALLSRTHSHNPTAVHVCPPCLFHRSSVFGDTVASLTTTSGGQQGVSCVVATHGCCAVLQFFPSCTGLMSVSDVKRQMQCRTNSRSYQTRAFSVRASPCRSRVMRVRRRPLRPNTRPPAGRPARFATEMPPDAALLFALLALLPSPTATVCLLDDLR